MDIFINKKSWVHKVSSDDNDIRYFKHCQHSNKIPENTRQQNKFGTVATQRLYGENSCYAPLCDDELNKCIPTQWTTKVRHEPTRTYFMNHLMSLTHFTLAS